MTSTLRSLTLASTAAFALSANAASPALNVTVAGITNGKPVPEKQAVCLPTPDGKSNTNGENIRPTINWSAVPAGTKSIAVFVMDPDVPADFTDAGKEGKIIAKNAKRQDFFHYAIVNIPADATSLPGGTEKVTGTELINDMGANKYVPNPTDFGGPCPPWNDERIHNYHFIVMALDNTPDTSKSAKESFNELSGSSHVLAKGAVVGTYTLNPSLRK